MVERAAGTRHYRPPFPRDYRGRGDLFLPDSTVAAAARCDDDDDDDTDNEEEHHPQQTPPDGEEDTSAWRYRQEFLLPGSEEPSIAEAGKTKTIPYGRNFWWKKGWRPFGPAAVLIECMDEWRGV